jgi:hypothetical protein
MSADIEFKSHVNVTQRSSLEALLYFNACQCRVSDRIANAVEKFGAPEIVADRDRLRIYLKHYPEVQSLFAIERATGRPVGVAIYSRKDLEHITVMHIGVAGEYASGGPRAGAQLLLRLLREVRRSARRVKGVRSLELYYATRRNDANRWRDAAKAAV